MEIPEIKKAIKVIKEGGVVICPTETVYGLLADAANDKAVERVFKIKKRPKTKAIAVFIRSIGEAKKLAFINEKQEKFLKKVWPGKVTVILKRKPNCGLSKKLFANKKIIGLRISSSGLVNKLVEGINRPLTTTSANISSRPASTKIKEVLEQFTKNKIRPDLVIDAGNLPKNKPSKVIDLTGEKEKVLRY
jgi:L-threonylcarbamoyladenylate synthase